MRAVLSGDAEMMALMLMEFHDTDNTTLPKPDVKVGERKKIGD